MSRRLHPALEASLGLLVVSLVAGWLAFPDRVAVYYTPAPAPDVVLPRLLGLLLVPLGGIAFGFAACQGLVQMIGASTGIWGLYGSRREGSSYALAVLVLWGSVSTWLVVLMGNAPDRAWAELGVTVLAAVTLMSLIGLPRGRTGAADARV